jgi:magnesium transporter
MIKIYCKDDNNDISVFTDFSKQLPDVKDILWVDMLNPESAEFKLIASKYNVEFPTKQETEEIEVSSRYWESSKDITVNTYFFTLVDGLPHNETVSFILQDNFLVTIRYRELKTFVECTKKITSLPKLFSSGFHIFSNILELRIDMDADILENIARGISNLRKNLLSEDMDSEELLESISINEDHNTRLRESLIDKQRLLSAILKSPKLPEALQNNFKIMIKDVNSLIDYTKFNFDRLDYIQNIFLGQLGIEQNNIIKIFTIVNVIFLPPTLVASIYGMNFKYFPELDWPFGYPLSLLIMVFSSVLPLVIFKKKGWM